MGQVKGEAMEDGIVHRMVDVNGIRMHVAEKGEGPVVLLLHGFPELWYSWRHQIHGLAARGFRAVAPDLRGFGDTDAPQGVDAYTMFHVVGDLVSLIRSLDQDQVFVVGHDWGALVAWALCLFRPDLVGALVNLSVAYRSRDPARRPVEKLRALYGDDYYICAFQVTNSELTGDRQRYYRRRNRADARFQSYFCWNEALGRHYRSDLKDLVISLPGGLRGFVHAKDASDVVADNQHKVPVLLPKTLPVGKLVSCVVL